MIYKNQYKNITQKDRELIRYWILKSIIKLRDEILTWKEDTEIKQYYLDFLDNHIERERSNLYISLKDQNKLKKLLALDLSKKK